MRAGFSLAEKLLVVNFYGSLMLGAALACVLLGGYLICGGAVGLGMITVIPAVPLCWFGRRISRRLSVKTLVATRALQKIDRHGYSEEAFAVTCSDPCMRLVTRYIHWRTGNSGRLAQVLARYGSTRLVLFESSAEMDVLVETGALSTSDLEQAVSDALRQQGDSSDRIVRQKARFLV